MATGPDDGPAQPAVVPITALRPSNAAPLLLEDGGTAAVEPVEFAGRPYLFKRYLDRFRGAARADALDRLISWRADRPEPDRRMIAAIAAWPRFAVHDRRGLAGMLIPPAPDAFVRGRQPRTLDMLPDPGDGAPGERREALAIKLNAFGHLIAAVTWFHDHGVVINDLHAYNVLVSRFGDAVHLVDCDSMAGTHWQPVLPDVAPDSMREVIPEVDDDPSVPIDLARLAHVIVSLLVDDEIFEIGEPTVAHLAGLVGDPVARFLCSACSVAAFQPDAVRRWLALGAAWRAEPAWATAPGIEVSEPQPVWEPPFEPLLPAGFRFPALNVAAVRPPLVTPAPRRPGSLARPPRGLLARPLGELLARLRGGGR